MSYDDKQIVALQGHSLTLYEGRERNLERVAKVYELISMIVEAKFVHLKL